MNDRNIITSTEDVNTVDQDLSNFNVSVNNKNLNIKNSKLNNSKLVNNDRKVEIFDSIIKNSNLTFNSNNEIIIKNSKFFNTIISVTGVKTLYLINCSVVNSSVNSSTTNLLTLDIIDIIVIN
ncbi:hypothetical protein ALNOE001_20910 [Candidatus Methanobinarius endosymbioticus]|uniref:Uncharacterized protein n=1 Tax=Candidatus Methanobinarius endosymbioticus TaxID=2006182 RepID=A0A366M7Y7_9EURY|nr:hypothetical protein ALNOE001_20910 [Candidatus Methanobinarius endosymbioticus]